jgi:dipeptidase E
MPRILLTSNGFSTQLIKDQFLLIAVDKVRDLRAAIITTASPQKEHNRFAIKAKADFLELGLNQVDFLDVEFDEPEQLEKYKVVYKSGGNPYYLLYHIRKSGADTILKKMERRNAVFIGVSAGAMDLGLDIKVVDYFTPAMNSVGLVDRSALGLTETAVFPHYDREDLFTDPAGKTIEERLQVFERMNQCSVTRIREDQSVLIT